LAQRSNLSFIEVEMTLAQSKTDYRPAARNTSVSQQIVMLEQSRRLNAQQGLLLAIFHNVDVHKRARSLPEPSDFIGAFKAVVYRSKRSQRGRDGPDHR
jgi:hypothetical protein